MEKVELENLTIKEKCNNELNKWRDEYVNKSMMLYGQVYIDFYINYIQDEDDTYRIDIRINKMDTLSMSNGNNRIPFTINSLIKYIDNIADGIIRIRLKECYLRVEVKRNIINKSHGYISIDNGIRSNNFYIRRLYDSTGTSIKNTLILDEYDGKNKKIYKNKLSSSVSRIDKYIKYGLITQSGEYSQLTEKEKDICVKLISLYNYISLCETYIEKYSNTISINISTGIYEIVRRTIKLCNKIKNSEDDIEHNRFIRIKNKLADITLYLLPMLISDTINLNNNRNRNESSSKEGYIYESYDINKLDIINKELHTKLMKAIFDVTESDSIAGIMTNAGMKLKYILNNYSDNIKYQYKNEIQQSWFNLTDDGKLKYDLEPTFGSGDKYTVLKYYIDIRNMLKKSIHQLGSIIQLLTRADVIDPGEISELRKGVVKLNKRYDEIVSLDFITSHIDNIEVKNIIDY